MANAKPSELELQVLSVLWERGPLTARETLAAMPDGKERAYTTVLSVLQGMEKKGLVRHTRRGTAHVYHPEVTRQQALGPILRRLVSHVFGGSPAAAMQQLLSETNVDDEELRRIRALIDQYEDAASGDDGGDR